MFIKSLKEASLNNFFIDYRDPIFGIIIFFAIVLLIAVLSYFWGIFNIKNNKNSIEKFVKNLESNSEFSEKNKELLKQLDLQSQVVLANIFTKNGDFEKAVTILLISLEHCDKENKDYILTTLGKVYFKAGFLERAKECFIQSIALKSQNEEALKFLSIIYEKLKLYKESYEVLEVLEEIGVDTKDTKNYIKTLMILSTNKNFDEKIQSLAEISNDFTLAKRQILELFLQNKEPFEKLKIYPNLKDCVDILWNLKTQINDQDKNFASVFYANGTTNKFNQGEIFEINLLCNLRKNSFKNAGLNFSYVCKNCKMSSPVFFYRCPFCQNVSSAKIVLKIVENSSETSYAF